MKKRIGVRDEIGLAGFGLEKQAERLEVLSRKQHLVDHIRPPVKGLARDAEELGGVCGVSHRVCQRAEGGCDCRAQRVRARIPQTGFFGRCDAGCDKVLDAVGRLEMWLAKRQQGNLGGQDRLCAGKAFHGKHGDVAACLGVTLGACLDEVGCKELVVGRGRGEVEDAISQFRSGKRLTVVEDRGGVDVQIPEDVGVLERTVGIGEGHDVGVAGNRTRARHLRFLLGSPCLVV